MDNTSEKPSPLFAFFRYRINPFYHFSLWREAHQKKVKDRKKFIKYLKEDFWKIEPDIFHPAMSLPVHLQPNPFYYDFLDDILENMIWKRGVAEEMETMRYKKVAEKEIQVYLKTSLLKHKTLLRTRFANPYTIKFCKFLHKYT